MGLWLWKKTRCKKDRDAFCLRVKEHEERLRNEQEEKTAAQEESQRYCDEIVATRLLKAKLEGGLSKVEALKNEAREEGKKIASAEIDSHLEAAKEEGREEIKTMFDPLIDEFNVRVLMHRDLTFLGECYLESLAEARKTLIEIKKAEHGIEEVDEGALIKEFLKGNEPSDLSAAKVIYCKGSPSIKGKEVIAGSSGIESPTRVPTQPASRPILDHFEQHIGYDPEDHGLGVHVLSPIPEGETP